MFVFPHLVLEEGHRYDEWNKATVKVIDKFEKFLLFIASELFLEISHNMLKHISVLRDNVL